MTHPEGTQPSGIPPPPLSLPITLLVTRRFPRGREQASLQAGMGSQLGSESALLFNCQVSLLVSLLRWLAVIDIINRIVSRRMQNALRSGS